MLLKDLLMKLDVMDRMNMSDTSNFPQCFSENEKNEKIKRRPNE